VAVGRVATNVPAMQVDKTLQTRSLSGVGGDFSYSSAAQTVSFLHEVPSSYSLSPQAESAPAPALPALASVSSPAAPVVVDAPALPPDPEVAAPPALPPDPTPASPPAPAPPVDPVPLKSRCGAEHDRPKTTNPKTERRISTRQLLAGSLGLVQYNASARRADDDEAVLFELELCVAANQGRRRIVTAVGPSKTKAEGKSCLRRRSLSSTSPNEPSPISRPERADCAPKRQQQPDSLPSPRTQQHLECPPTHHYHPRSRCHCHHRAQ